MLRLKEFFQNKFFLSFLCGAFCALAFAPINFFPAAIISLTGFFLLLEKALSEPFAAKKFFKSQIFRLGFFYGFGYFLAGIYWIAISLTVDLSSFGWLIPFALTLIPGALALYLALMAVCYKILIDKFQLQEVYQKILLFALLWLAAEILRANLFTGFPWNLLGYVWMFDVSFAQVASVFGIYGLSVFAVVVCLFPVIPLLTCVGASGARPHQDRDVTAGERRSPLHLGDKILTVVTITFFLFNALYGIERVSRQNFVDGSESLVRLVQANIKQEMKWDPQQKYQNFMKHIELTNSRPLNGIAAVIWSESSLPYLLEEKSELVTEMKKAVPFGGVLISGAVRVEGDQENPKFWNSVFVLSHDGITGIYDKHHLVPFGEYIPLQKFLPFVQKITDGAVGFSEGEGAKVLALRHKIDSVGASGARPHQDFDVARATAGRPYSFSPLICYEAIFSREVLPKNSAADFFVNVTNDAWFGASSGPYQHLNIARMRSIEYGMPLIRVAGTGISALVDPFGRVIAQLNLNEEGVLDVPLIKKLPETFYAKYGHLALLLLVVVMVVGIAWERRHPARKKV
jgi:apolipoprotein N-acyltransferase